MNQILHKQNEPEYIEMLAAQRQLYRDERRWTLYWLATVVAVAVVSSGLIVWASPMLAVLATLNFVLLGVELYALERVTKQRRQKAALIQEVFDCGVLELPWNDVIGRKPQPVEIVEAAARFQAQNDQQEWNRLKNWYSVDIANLPLHRARIACQMQNIWWDGKQRREYAMGINLMTGLVVVLVVLLSILANLSLQQFFLGPVVLLSAIVYYALRHAHEQRKAAERLEEMQQIVDDLSQAATQEPADVPALTTKSRQLQDAIYHNRSDNSPVFEWYYNRILEKYERLAKGLK